MERLRHGDRAAAKGGLVIFGSSEDERAWRQTRSNLNTATLARKLGNSRTACPSWTPKASRMRRPHWRASTSKSAKVLTRMLGVSDR